MAELPNPFIDPAAASCSDAAEVVAVSHPLHGDGQLILGSDEQLSGDGSLISGPDRSNDRERASSSESSAGECSSFPSEKGDPALLQDWAPAELHIPELLVSFGHQGLSWFELSERGFCPHDFMDRLEEIVAEIADVPLFIVQARMAA